LVVFSSKVGERKKRLWRQVCEWLSVAVACLPAAVSLLLLEALFMQISGVSLTLTWPCRLCLLRVLLCTSHCYKLSPFQAHWGGDTAPTFFGLQVCLQLMWEVGLLPLSCGVFLPPPLLQSFWLLLGGCVLLLLPAGCVCLQVTWEVGLPPSPVEFSSLRHSHKLSRSWLLGVLPRSHRSLSSQAWLVYLQFQEGFPSPPLRRSVHPTSLQCVFIVLIAYYSVSLFSPGGGWSVQGAMLLWPRVICGSTAVLLSSPCPHLHKPSGCGHLAAWGPSWFLCLT
jgi:hypothetical protein